MKPLYVPHNTGTMTSANFSIYNFEELHERIRIVVPHQQHDKQQ